MRLATALAAVALALVLGAVVPRPLFEGTDLGQDINAPTVPILVLSNPIHTDILLPLDAGLLARFPALTEAGLPVVHPLARWLAFGWGSRAFFIETPTWSDLRPGPLLKALTLDQSVMHVSVLGDFDRAAPGVTALHLDLAAYERLVAFIDGSFARDVFGRMVLVEGASYGADDAFFDAVGRFNALAGCNTWTAGALRTAGIQTGWWNPLPQSLAWSVSLHNALRP